MATFREMEPVKVTLLPLDVTERHYISQIEWEKCCRGSKLADWVRMITAAYFSSSQVVWETADQHKAFFHDALCVWYILHGDTDSLFKTNTMDVRAETVGQWTRGMCCVDRRPENILPKSMKSVSEWVYPGLWIDSSMGNAVGVVQETPGRKEWVASFCRALFGDKSV